MSASITYLFFSYKLNYQFTRGVWFVGLVNFYFCTQLFIFYKAFIFILHNNVSLVVIAITTIVIVFEVIFGVTNSVYAYIFLCYNNKITNKHARSLLSTKHNFKISYNVLCLRFTVLTKAKIKQATGNLMNTLAFILTKAYLIKHLHKIQLFELNILY